jgi:preprotein translocase subunit SecA
MSDAATQRHAGAVARPHGSRVNGGPRHRPVDDVGTWLRARLSLLGAARRRRRVLAVGRAVAALEDEFRALDQAALDARRRTIAAALRRRGLASERVVEALALVRETCRRQIGLLPYMQQVVAGYALLGNAAVEMDTGEGKTLTAVFASAVYAFCGRSVHVVTANDYLASRDGELLRPVFEALGIAAGIVVHGMSPPERRAAYTCAVTFVSNKEVAFDYLRDRLMAETVTGDVNIHRKTRRILGMAENAAPVLGGLDVAIVDEIDSVLVDDAGTPLMISADMPSALSDEDARAAFDLATGLHAGEDFIADKHGIAAELTEAGRARADALAARLGGIWHNRIRRYELVRDAVTAVHCLEGDRHYIVRDGKVLIIDEYSGRVMPDRYWGHNLHRMVEVKEGCEATGTRKSLASISFQRFFRSYRDLAGMSGTIREVALELATVYGLSLVRIPRRRPLRRAHLGRTLCATRDDLWAVAARRILALYRSGQPVLIGVRTVGEAERGSRALAALDVPHAVLSAAQDRQEAEIVARAGQKGAVTIATNMAGRGTDILLGEGVADLGGLVVAICERNDASRIDRQLMGRCARQGDPGQVIEFLSLEDRILKLTWRILLPLATLRPLAPRCAGIPFRHGQWRAERENARRRYRLVKHDEHLGKMLAFAGGLD